MARELPPHLGQPLILAIRCLAAHRITDRLVVWRELNPGRSATHAQIASEIGARREGVTRAVGRLRRTKRCSN